MKSIKLILIISLALITNNSCNKKNKTTKTLPAITQNGANTFGCKINGEIYSVTGLYENNPVGCAEGNSIPIGLTKTISSSNCSSDINYKGIVIYINEEFAVKKYILKEYGQSEGRCFKSIPSTNYYTDSLNNGELNITRADNIIAGTFWFDARAQDGSIVHVTEGRFDITKQ
jgi:hypothetical protein